MSQKIFEKSKKGKIYAVISKMEIAEETSKTDMIKEIYNDNDYFITRSWDVLFLNAKKLIPERKFKVSKGVITRVL